MFFLSRRTFPLAGVDEQGSVISNPIALPTRILRSAYLTLHAPNTTDNLFECLACADDTSFQIEDVFFTNVQALVVAVFAVLGLKLFLGHHVHGQPKVRPRGYLLALVCDELET